MFNKLHKCSLYSKQEGVGFNFKISVTRHVHDKPPVEPGSTLKPVRSSAFDC